MSDLPAVPVGFDYIRALLRIRRKMSYQKIADYVGYRSRNAICRVVKGTQPAHAQGEAIYALYVELFGERPPMTLQQRAGNWKQSPKVAIP